MTSAVPSRGRMNIGEVLDKLRTEFPDVTISKIRYLETEGLVEPERTPSGYRKFAHADVDRLRYVLTMQRDKFLPLREIRKNLDSIDRGLQPATGDEGTPRVPHIVLAADGYPTADSMRTSTHDLRLSRAELLEGAKIDEPLLQEMEIYGLLPARPARGHYGSSELTIATTVGELAAFGLEPRHLRAFRTAADREIGLFEQIVDSQRKRHDTAAGGKADETIRTLAALSVRLHTMLVKSGLQ